MDGLRGRICALPGGDGARLLGHQSPRTDFPAFALNAQADPVGSLAPNGTLQVVPPGKRSYYCLMQVGLMSSAQGPFRPAMTLCSRPRRTVMMASRGLG